MKDNCMSIQSIWRKQTGQGRHLKPCTTWVFPKKTLLDRNRSISFRTMLHYRMVPLTVVYHHTSCWWSVEVWFLFIFFKSTQKRRGSTLHHQTEPQQGLSAAMTTGRPCPGPAGPTLTAQGESGWTAQKPGSGATVPIFTTTQYLSQPPEPQLSLLNI